MSGGVHSDVHVHTHSHTLSPHTGLRTQSNTFLSGGMERIASGKFSTVESLLDHFESEFGTSGDT